MTIIQTDSPTRRPLRLWPGVVIVVVQWLAWVVLPRLVPDATIYGVLGAFLCGLLVVVWWLFFSRAPWLERLGAIALMIVAVYATARVVHPSILNGAMGMLLPMLAIPALCLALVVWAAATRSLSVGARRAALVGAIALACAGLTLVRTGGMSGGGEMDFHWRWTPTPEERLQALAGEEPEGLKPTPPSPTAGADWPGFRGPDRDGVVHAVNGARVATDWTASPPKEMWRRPIGPGWSSFAVRGDLLYTQEQRGEDEIVACHNLTTGQPVWWHKDAARFWESNAGAGPRATPTLSNGRVYTLGATGIVNALDAGSGAVVWTRNAATDTGKKIPGWGFASSPLVVDDTLVVATAGKLAAYDIATGNPRWIGAADGHGYSSPHLLTIDGVPQVLLLNGDGAISVAPADGAVLWKYDWPGDGIVQPAMTADGDLLIGTGSGMGSGAGMGVRRIAVAHGPGGWTMTERWTSTGLKPYFNDFVVHKGHAYGFDGSILGCIDLADGKRSWKGGRYGNGQLILLPDQDLLLVLSEQGDLALVGATPDRFTELARMPAIKGKTWNHPVLAGDVLLVRNDQEMVAYRMSPAGR